MSINTINKNELIRGGKNFPRVLLERDYGLFCGSLIGIFRLGFFVFGASKSRFVDFYCGIKEYRRGKKKISARDYKKG